MVPNERVRWFMIILGVFVVSISKSCVYGEQPQVPCFFIFGDSLLDNGNNNFLSTLAKVNYVPYGIDFPGGPTGRFCNGRTTVDIIAELLGFEFPIPPFATTIGTVILRGLNYASGSAGIRQETGTELGINISFDNQLLNHQATTVRIAVMFGDQALAQKYLNKCLYYVGMGNNDYINNYFQPNFFNTSRVYTLEQYADVLIEQYSRQIMTLYKLGARKVALVGVSKIQNATDAFNQKLLSLVDKHNADLKDAKFIFVNSTEVTRSASAGFKVSETSCCRTNQVGLCVPFEAPCQNRSEYAFWDSFHPSEASNIITGGRIYSSSNRAETHPMDIKHLVQLSLYNQKQTHM